MESISQVSNDSFSYGWLSNKNSTFDRLEDSLRRSFDALDGSSFIEMDPDFFSMRWTNLSSFDFSLPASCKSSNLVHADQIFSNGQLLPSQLSSPSKKKEACNFPSDSAMARSISLDSLKTLLSQTNHWDDSVSANTSPILYSSYSMPLNSVPKKLKLPLFRPSKNSPGKVLRKYLYFFINPLYKKVKKLRIKSLRTTRSCGDSPVRSSRISDEFSSIDRRNHRVFDLQSESSITDAVLHCKKSIANSNGLV